MFSREVSDLTSFYLFLTSSENPNFAEFLDWLGMDKAVEFFKRFGGQNIEVPCLEELDKAIRYFRNF